MSLQPASSLNVLQDASTIWHVLGAILPCRCSCLPLQQPQCFQLRSCLQQVLRLSAATSRLCKGTYCSNAAQGCIIILIVQDLNIAQQLCICRAFCIACRCNYSMELHKAGLHHSDYQQSSSCPFVAMSYLCRPKCAMSTCEPSARSCERV